MKINTSVLYNFLLQIPLNNREIINIKTSLFKQYFQIKIDL